ncbi:hypothetical protein LI90_2152 [Carbonactinospora thermoautotrophica]|uniref:Uncharacterized protein n=2 Tax=Carbonactinospora thermoautotrophica TaxID=1469144 RepID=A0A132MTJ6_9ACTN|nr:hypothetical protein LI90_2152 [Carbonactinospora thermoautotrophica]
MVDGRMRLFGTPSFPLVPGVIGVFVRARRVRPRRPAGARGAPAGRSPRRSAA